MFFDFKQALRTLWRRKSFSLLVIATLGLGIGANVGIFSYLSYFVRPTIEAPAPERVHWLWNRNGDEAYDRFSWLDYQLFEQELKKNGVSDMLAFNLFGASLETGEKNLYTFGFATTGDYFSFFDARPFMGRFYDQSDDQPGASPVVVLSHLTWKRHFASDPDIVGRQVDLEGRSYTVIGVTQPGFQGTGVWAHLFVPVATVDDFVVDRSNHDERKLAILTRLDKKAEPRALQEQLDNLAAQLEEQYPGEYPARAPYLISFREDTQPEDSYRRAARMLLIATFLLLLLACASVANLMLARALERRKEIGILAALGAGRMRVSRHLLFESLVLAVLGGALGLLFSHGVTLFIESYLRDTVTLGLGEFSLGSRLVRNDRLVVPFAVGLTLLVGIAAGLAPALMAARTDLVSILKSTSDAGARKRSFLPSVRASLVVVQVALSVAVLLGSALLARNLVALQTLDLGFEPDGLTLATVYVPRDLAEADSANGESGGAGIERWNRLRDEIETMPGVQAASFSWRVPLGFIDGAELVPSGFDTGGEDDKGPEVKYTVVGQDWFETMGTPIVEGRGFNGQDRSDTRSVAVVNQSAARLLRQAGGNRGDVLGATFELNLRSTVPEGEIEVVGVVRDSRYTFPQDAIGPIVFLPFEQAYRGRMTLMVRANSQQGDAAASMTTTLRTFLSQRFPELSLVGVHPFEEQVRRSFTDHRMNAQIGGILAALALLMATFGVFSVMSYMVSLRRREIGVRMAIGATGSDVARTVVGSAGRLVGLGLILGLVLAVALGRLLEGVVFGVELNDPLTFVMVPVVLLVSGLLAALLPALRARRIDPARVLRSE